MGKSLICAISFFACLSLATSAHKVSLEVTYKKCAGPYKHAIRLHVYNIKAREAAEGVSEKNAADTLGDFAFIFGSRGVPSPRGVKQYFDSGVIELNHISVSSWGDYQQCNHAPGSTKYHCACPVQKLWCERIKAGKVSNSHTNGHIWYSFPAAGEGKYWDYEKGAGCERIRVTAKCVIQRLASAAGCPHDCASSRTADRCVKCVGKLSEKEQEHVWDEAVLGRKCKPLSMMEEHLPNAGASSANMTTLMV